MENLSIRYVFDRKNTATLNKQGLLQIEVRVNKTSQKKFISTGIKLYKNQFSDKNGFTCIAHPNSQIITGKARRIFNKIEAFVNSDECISLQSVKDWDKDSAKTHLVTDFIRAELRRRDVSMNVLELHHTLIRRLEEFDKIKTFADLTYANIADFDCFLRRTIKSQPTLYKRHANFRRVIREAQKRKICEYNPYDDFEVRRGKSKTPIYLTEKEISQIVNYVPTNEKLQHTKDLFIFQIFTGMAYIDMANFNTDYISEISGKKVIRSNRQKTDESFVSLLLPQAEKIIEKYNNKLPIISNQKYNDYLKLLAAGAEINKNLTSHTARHTFATYLLNHDVPIESVSRAMGHASIKMTQHYAKMLGKKVVNDMAKLLV